MSETILELLRICIDRLAKSKSNLRILVDGVLSNDLHIQFTTKRFDLFKGHGEFSNLTSFQLNVDSTPISLSVFIKYLLRGRHMTDCVRSGSAVLTYKNVRGMSSESLHDGIRNAALKHAAGVFGLETVLNPIAKLHLASLNAIAVLEDDDHAKRSALFKTRMNSAEALLALTSGGDTPPRCTFLCCSQHETQ
jgi:hypothetical protein